MDHFENLNGRLKYNFKIQFASFTAFHVNAVNDLTAFTRAGVEYGMVDKGRRVGAELAIIISYPTSDWNNCVIKPFPKYRKLNTKKLRVRSFNTFVEHGIISNY